MENKKTNRYIKVQLKYCEVRRLIKMMQGGKVYFLYTFFLSQAMDSRMDVCVCVCVSSERRERYIIVGKRYVPCVCVVVWVLQ